MPEFITRKITNSVPTNGVGVNESFNNELKTLAAEGWITIKMDAVILQGYLLTTLTLLKEA